MDATLYLLLGRARALVLNVLNGASRHSTVEPLHLREIARRTALSPTAVQYELRLLRQVGMVEDIGTSGRPLYVLNRDHVLFADMHAMFTRTAADSHLLADDAHFARKRARQREDHAATGPEENSPFLRQQGSLRHSVKVS